MFVLSPNITSIEAISLPLWLTLSNNNLNTKYGNAKILY